MCLCLMCPRSTFPTMRQEYRHLLGDNEQEEEIEEETKEEGHLQEEKEEETDDDEEPEDEERPTIAVMQAVRYTARNDETGEEDKEQIRCSKSFMGAPWQDGIQLIADNDLQGQRRKHNLKTKSGLEIAYEPTAKRIFGIVHLLFEYKDLLWLLVEKLEGADNKSGVPPWQKKDDPQLAASQDAYPKRGQTAPQPQV